MAVNLQKSLSSGPGFCYGSFIGRTDRPGRGIMKNLLEDLRSLTVIMTVSAAGGAFYQYIDDATDGIDATVARLIDDASRWADENNVPRPLGVSLQIIAKHGQIDIRRRIFQ